jgi:selenocysteine lyase/cysteine desulfurase
MSDKELSSLLRKQFPTSETMHYANHAAISPWPRVTADAVSQFARENAESGPMKYGQWMLNETRLRRRLATLLNAHSPDDIALLKNTSEGVSTVAAGIDWRAGDNLVIPEGEFPSNHLAWQNLQNKGVEVRTVPILEAFDPESALLDAMDERTRLLTVSAVQWDHGLRLDLKRLGRQCRNGDTLFFVDAIQQMGALGIDVQDACIDFLAASAHKWLLGPEGIAVFYCHENCRNHLELSQFGWRMTDNPFELANPNRPHSLSARRFEAGSPNMVGQAGLNASISLFEDIGMQTVEKMVLQNTDRLLDGLGKLEGVKIISRQEPERRSGIVSFTVTGKDPALLRKRLAANKLYVAERNRMVRISPHFYQAGPCLEDMLNTLEDTLSK